MAAVDVSRPPRILSPRMTCVSRPISTDSPGHSPFAITCASANPLRFPFLLLITKVTSRHNRHTNNRNHHHIPLPPPVDIDECKTANGGCFFKSNSLLRQCVNTDGGRVCGDCPKGYTNDGEAGCSGQYG